MSLQQESFSSIFVARQPIFDSADAIWGYELLFRDNPEATEACVKDADLATATVIADGLMVALEAVEPQHKLLINFPTDLLLNGTAQVLPPDKCVLEILEDVRPTTTLIVALQRLKASDYMLALDDYIGQTEAAPLLKLAGLIKVDVLGLHPEALADLVKGLKSYPARLLAEKVEDAATHNLCKQLGFTLFQGYFFSRPQLVRGRKLAAGQLARLTLLHDTLGSLDIQKLIQVITTDPALTYRLLRYINSSWFSLIQNVVSVPQAVHLLGGHTVQRWLTTALMADMGTSAYNRELSLLAVTRGRFLEQMAGQGHFAGTSPETLLMLGLLSCLDAQLGVPMKEVVEQLPLDPALKRALTGKASDELLGQGLELALQIERGGWDRCMTLLPLLALSSQAAAAAFNEAQIWARRILSPNPAGRENPDA